MNAPQGISLKDNEFKSLSQLIYNKFGIHLPEAKKNLLLTRLQKTVADKKFDSYAQYYNFLIEDSSGEALSALINQISTNFTYFYREPEHFTFFYKSLLPQLEILHKADHKLRIWCAGCSTGEEAYLLAIMMNQYFGNNYSQWDAGLLATDISQRALNKAVSGIYNKESITKIPPMFRNSYFSSLDKEKINVVPRIQKEITFRRFNLMNQFFPFKDKFDAIFCRNVMIYFDASTREGLVNRFINQLTVGGHLFIGHSETISRDTPRLKYICPSLYQRIS